MYMAFFSPQTFLEWGSCRWCPWSWSPQFLLLLAPLLPLPDRFLLQSVCRSLESVRGNTKHPSVQSFVKSQMTAWENTSGQKNWSAVLFSGWMLGEVQMWPVLFNHTTTHSTHSRHAAGVCPTLRRVQHVSTNWTVQSNVGVHHHFTFNNTDSETRVERSF